jgi:anti-anti-sigma factor
MTDPRFAATVRSEGDSMVVDLIGDINAFATEDLESATAAALAEAPQRLVLNYRGTAFINSTGIALIVGVLAKARAAKVHVVACGLTNHYREIFEITRLVDFMDIAADEETALAATTVFGIEREGSHDDA